MPKPTPKEKEDEKPVAGAPAPALENADADRAGTLPPSRPELSRSELETLREKLRRKFH